MERGKRSYKRCREKEKWFWITKQTVVRLPYKQMSDGRKWRNEKKIDEASVKNNTMENLSKIKTLSFRRTSKKTMNAQQQIERKKREKTEIQNEKKIVHDN